MVDDICLKPIGVQDVNLLQVVALKAYCDHYLHLWHDGGAWYIKKSFSTEQLTQELNDADARFYLAYFKDEPAGFLKINLHASMNNSTPLEALELERIYLSNAFVGKGLGKALVNLTIDIAKQYHKKLIWLKAMDTSHEAIRFYENMGFIRSGVHTLPFTQMKEEFRGMVIMHKSL